jgi:hypothetical protein
MRKLLLAFCLLCSAWTMGYGQGAPLSNVITYSNQPSPLEEFMEYEIEPAPCKNGMGRIRFYPPSSGGISCEGGPCVLEFAAYQGSIEIVPFTAITDFSDAFRGDSYFSVPGDDETSYVILVRKQSAPSEIATLLTDIIIPNSTADVTMSGSPTITHPNCDPNAGVLNFPPLSGDVSNKGYVIYRANNLAGSNNTGLFTGLQEGTYRLYGYDRDANFIVSSTDPGEDNTSCYFFIGSYTLTRDVGFTVGTVTTTNVVCRGANDGTVTITPSPVASDYVFSDDAGATWTAAGASHTFTGVFPATYTSYRVAKSGNTSCNLTVPSLTISEPTEALTASGSSSTECQLTASASGGWGTYEYRLSTLGTWQSNATFTGLTAGNYTVYARDAQGCEVSSANQVTVACTPVGRATAASQNLSIYPNPTQGSFRISAAHLAGSTARVELVDVLGKVVSQQQVAVGANGLVTTLTPAAPGVYFVRVSANGQQYLQRVVRQ